jgi:hypothetical protein
MRSRAVSLGSLIMFCFLELSAVIAGIYLCTGG